MVESFREVVRKKCVVNESNVEMVLGFNEEDEMEKLRIEPKL